MNIDYKILERDAKRKEAQRKTFDHMKNFHRFHTPTAGLPNDLIEDTIAILSLKKNDCDSRMRSCEGSAARIEEETTICKGQAVTLHKEWDMRRRIKRLNKQLADTRERRLLKVAKEKAAKNQLKLSLVGQASV